LLTELTRLLRVAVDVVESGSLQPYIRDRVLTEAVPI
jgi:predicted nucleotidyltransferase